MGFKVGQQTLVEPTNTGLFSDYYIKNRLPEATEWKDSDPSTAFEEILDLWDEVELAGYNEEDTKDDWIEEILKILGHEKRNEVGIQAEHWANPRSVDHVLFPNSETAGQFPSGPLSEREIQQYEVLGLLEAKRWKRNLDRTTGDENPSQQTHSYLQYSGIDWGILTNGKLWRLYHRESSHRDEYYEIDLPNVLNFGKVEAFKYFYLFFRADAFLGENCWLDRVREATNEYRKGIGEELEDQVYEALRLIAQGFINYPDNELDGSDAETLQEVHDNSLIVLYRILFLLYAESRGLLPMKAPSARGEKPRYQREYSFEQLKHEVVDQLSEGEKGIESVADTWQDLQRIWGIVAEGNEKLGVPVYNGGLFDPDRHPFLENHAVGDRYLRPAIKQLTRAEAPHDDGEAFVDYSDLNVRHLGTIYEGLLEYELRYAVEPLVVEEAQYTPADDAKEPEVESGDVYLITDRGERKATGSYYTPDYVVRFIVERTVGPLVRDLRAKYTEDGEITQREELRDEILELNIVDPAMGSGHFLVEVVDFLARELIDITGEQDLGEDETELSYWRRRVAGACIYGVDKNPLAVELAKLSLWLKTAAKDKPLSFLDHHLRCGDSLLGASVEELPLTREQSEYHKRKEREARDAGQRTFMDDPAFASKVKTAIQSMRDIEKIQGDTIHQIKKAEKWYNNSVRSSTQTPRRIADLFVAGKFLLNLDDEYFEEMARNLLHGGGEKVPEYAELEDKAEQLAAKHRFFHWELEFPEVYFDRHGRIKPQGGFDALVGNPPWIDLKGFENVSALFDFFETSFNRVNVYAAFFERSVDLLRSGGVMGFITPNSYSTQSSYKKLREYLFQNGEFRTLVRLPDGVFEDVTMETLITILEKSEEPTTDEVSVVIYPRTDDIDSIGPTYPREHTADGATWRESPDSIIDLFTSEDEAQVLSKLESHENFVDQEFDICLGLTPYDKHEGHSKNQIENEVFHADEKESEDHHRLTSGAGIAPFDLHWEGGEWIKYGPWLGAPRERRFFEDPRCVVRQIVGEPPYTLHAAFGDQTLFHTQVGFSLVPPDGDRSKALTLCGLINSKLLGFYHQKRFLDENKDTFQKVLIQDLRRFPLPSKFPDGELSDLVGTLSEIVPKRRKLNVDVRDYAAGIKFDETLNSYYEPVKGIHDTPADAYTTDITGLRIKSASVRNDNGRSVLSISFKYKPEDPSGVETTHHGFASTEPLPVMQFRGLDKSQRIFLKAFLEAAINDGIEGTEYKHEAKKGYTPLERLQNIRVPNLDKNGDAIRKFREVYEEAESLDHKIEEKRARIDERVYALYDLNNAEIQTVEKGLRQLSETT